MIFSVTIRRIFMILVQCRFVRRWLSKNDCLKCIFWPSLKLETLLVICDQNCQDIEPSRKSLNNNPAKPVNHVNHGQICRQMTVLYLKVSVKVHPLQCLWQPQRQDVTSEKDRSKIIAESSMVWISVHQELCWRK